jgi:hypothetical protein
VTRQTCVASYMLPKGQGLERFPWLGLTAARHHGYTHADGKAPGADGADGQRVLRDICKWHVEEFAYLPAKLKAMPEGDGNVLDRTCVLFTHEHAEASSHKASGMHSKVVGMAGDLYLTVADDVMGAGLGKFSTATQKICVALT